MSLVDSNSVSANLRPLEVYNSLHALQVTFDAKYDSLTSGLTHEQRTAQLTALRDETRQRLHGLLGAEGLSIYEGSTIGRWIQQIVPSVRPTAPPTAGP